MVQSTSQHVRHTGARGPGDTEVVRAHYWIWDRSAWAEVRGRHVAKDEGRVALLSLHTPRALHSSSIDELNSGRAHSWSSPRGSPLKSESLQKDHRTARYNHFGGRTTDAEGISPLCAAGARGSEPRCEARRASNSGLRGHCRAFGGPMGSAFSCARRVIGGAPRPRPSRLTARTSSKTRTLRALRGQGRARAVPTESRAASRSGTQPGGCVTPRKYFRWWNASELEHEIELMDGERAVGRRVTEWPAAVAARLPPCPFPS